MKSEFENGIRFALKDSMAEDHRLRVQDMLLDIVEGIPESELGWQALDPNLSTKGGGTAFLWEDVLAIGDAADIAADLLDLLSPLDAAKVILKMVLVWKRLRQVRVHLNHDEFKVLRAIKRGYSKIDEIAEYTDLPRDRVDEVIQELKIRKYREEIHLVEDLDGQLTTKF